MKTIVFSNNKGGCGKTTTAATIAEIWAKQGKRVLLMDLDGQANLSDTFGVPGGAVSTVDIFRTGVAEPTNIAPGLDIVPGSVDMAGIELSGKPQPLIVKLRAWLNAHAPQYDFALVDTPPALGVVTVSAFAVADWVVVPTQADTYAFTGLQRIFDMVQQVHGTNPGLDIAGVLFTRHNEKRRVNAAAEQALRNHYRERVFETVVHESVAVVEAVTTKHSVAAYAPNNRVAKDYNAAADELLRRIE